MYLSPKQDSPGFWGSDSTNQSPADALTAQPRGAEEYSWAQALVPTGLWYSVE